MSVPFSQRLRRAFHAFESPKNVGSSISELVFARLFTKSQRCLLALGITPDAFTNECAIEVEDAMVQLCSYYLHENCALRTYVNHPHMMELLTTFHTLGSEKVFEILIKYDGNVTRSAEECAHHLLRDLNDSATLTQHHGETMQTHFMKATETWAIHTFLSIPLCMLRKWSVFGLPTLVYALAKRCTSELKIRRKPSSTPFPEPWWFETPKVHRAEDVVSCSVCLNDFAPGKIDCPNGISDHAACVSCVRAYILNELYINRNATCACVSDCSGAYSMSTLKHILGVHFYAHEVALAIRYARGVLTDEAARLFMCVCGNVVECAPMESDPAEKLFCLRTCGLCGYEFCETCMQESHAFSRECHSQAVNRNRMKRDEMLTAAAVCSCVCGLKFVRSSGCNKMTCPCGKHMCFVCRSIITGYDHFCTCAHTSTCSKCHVTGSTGEKALNARLKAVKSTFIQ